MIYLLMVPAMAAAIWAWRMAEANLERYKCEAETERTKAAKWAELYDHKCKDLIELSRKHADTQLFLNGADQQNQQALDHINKLATKTEALENEIDGLNIDKLALKERLQKYEAAEQKRREQKRVGMQRYRANKKTK